MPPVPDLQSGAGGVRVMCIDCRACSSHAGQACLGLGAQGSQLRVGTHQVSRDAPVQPCRPGPIAHSLGERGPQQVPAQRAKRRLARKQPRLTRVWNMKRARNPGSENGRTSQCPSARRRITTVADESGTSSRGDQAIDFAVVRFDLRFNR